MTLRGIRLLLAVPLLAAGCTFRPQWPGPEETATRLAGTNEAIALDVIGGRLDAGEQTGDALSRELAIRLALRTHPEIQVALASVRLAFAEAQQERLLPNPILTVAVKFPLSGGAPTVEPGITADLMALLLKPGRVRAADHRLRAAGAEAVTVVLDVLTEVQKRYAEVQTLDAIMPVLEERRRLTDRLLEVARSRLKAGEGTRLDVTTLETQEVELEVEITERALELREARLELARLIGRPSDPARWKLDHWVAPTATITEEQVWIQAGLEHRPEVIARIWELSALGVEFRQGRWGIFQGSEIGAEAEGTVESGADDWAVGPSFTLPLPIFDWGQAGRSAASARRLEAAHQLTQARRGVVEDVRRAHAAFLATAQAYRRVVEQWIPLVERRREEAESQYRAGQSDVVPLILADQDLLAAQTKRIELERQTSMSLVRLHRAVGGPGAAPSTVAPPVAVTRPALDPQPSSTPRP